MAQYDFQCDNCGHVERDVRVKYEQKTMPCSACGAEMKRLFPLPTKHIWTGSSEGAMPSKGRK